jgi:hypothetical protein
MSFYWSKLGKLWRKAYARSMGRGQRAMSAGESPSALAGGRGWRPTQHPHPLHQDTWSQIRVVKALLREFVKNPLSSRTR